MRKTRLWIKYKIVKRLQVNVITWRLHREPFAAHRSLLRHGVRRQASQLGARALAATYG